MGLKWSVFKLLSWSEMSVNKKIFLAAICVTPLLSLWVFFTGGIINNDGILYMSIAERFAQGDFAGAAKLYNWNFYPLLIAELSRFTSLPLAVSAGLLTAFFSTLLTFAFLKCVLLLGGNRQVLLWAAVVIVLHPTFMESRSSILRDHGYWAFYLLAIYFFLNFYAKPIWSYAFLWGTSIMVACLFRVEGLLFLSLLPSVLLLRRGESLSLRVCRFAQSHIISILVMLLVVAFSVCDPHFSLLDKGRLDYPFSVGRDFYNLYTGGLAEKREVLATQIIPYAKSSAMSVLILIPFMILFKKLFSALTLMYVVPLCWKPFKYMLPPMRRKFFPVLIWLIALNCGMLLIFIFVSFLCQKRYVYPLALILLLLLPFILNGYFEKWKTLQINSSKIRWLKYPVIIIFLIYTYDGLLTIPGRSDYYIKDAGYWLRSNMPVQATIYTNYPKIYYYSRHMENYWSSGHPRDDLSYEFLQEAQVLWRGKKYVALWVTHRSDLTNREISEKIGATPDKIFQNGYNDRVLIYILK